MKDLDKELLNYVCSKTGRTVNGAVIPGRWSDRTASSNYHKLITVRNCSFDPDTLYTTLKGREASLYTIQIYFILARQCEEDLFKTSKFRKWMQDNPTAFKNAYQKKEKLMTDEQFGKILDSADSFPNLYNLILLMGKAGLRISEALAVKDEDFNDDQLKVVGKGGKLRYVPFKKEFLKLRSGNRVHNYRQFLKEFGFTPHDLRAYYATKVTGIAGMSIEDARDLLGHSSIITTAKYLRANKDRQKKLILENF